MLGLALAALVACPAPQDTATLDAPVYANAVYGVSLPRPFDDWVFEPGAGRRTTTVIFHPRDTPLRSQLWGALVLTTFSAPVALDRIVEQRVQGTWRRLLGRGFDVLARDSLTVAGRPAVRVLLTGAINGVSVDVEEYALASDSDLVLLQFRYPRGLPRDSLEAGYKRVVQGLTVGGSALFAAARAVPASFADSLATERVVPRSAWQAEAYDALVRFDTAGPRADFTVRVALVNDGETATDSVPLWLWPGLTLDSISDGPSAVQRRESGSVAWVMLPANAAPGERVVMTCVYHLQPGPGGLPPAVMGMSTGGAYALSGWLPRTQPAFDSAGQFAPAVRAPLTLRFDVPERWRVVAQGRLVSEARFDGRRRVTWQTDEVATSVAAFALGPYQAATGFGGEVPVVLWRTPQDSLTDEAADALVRVVQAAWIFCSRAFGRLPIREVSIATAAVPAPQGFAGLVLLDHRTAALFGLPHSASGGPPQEVEDAVIREIARTWWGSSVAAAGPGSAWIDESFPAWAALAARGVLEGDTARQRLVREVEAAWRAASAKSGDLPLATLSACGPRSDLLNTKGVAAIEAVRRALGEARFREVLLSLTHEHRNGWLTVEDVLTATGSDVATVLRTFLY